VTLNAFEALSDSRSSGRREVVPRPYTTFERVVVSNCPGRGLVRVRTVDPRGRTFAFEVCHCELGSGGTEVNSSVLESP
jgi:hypothetical protein